MNIAGDVFPQEFLLEAGGRSWKFRTSGMLPGVKLVFEKERVNQSSRGQMTSVKGRFGGIPRGRVG